MTESRRPLGLAREELRSQGQMQDPWEDVQYRGYGGKAHFWVTREVISTKAWRRSWLQVTGLNSYLITEFCPQYRYLYLMRISFIFVVCVFPNLIQTFLYIDLFIHKMQELGLFNFLWEFMHKWQWKIQCHLCIKRVLKFLENSWKFGLHGCANHRIMSSSMPIILSCVFS